jgi:hypothetical protein
MRGEVVEIWTKGRVVVVEANSVAGEEGGFQIQAAVQFAVRCCLLFITYYIRKSIPPRLMYSLLGPWLPICHSSTLLMSNVPKLTGTAFEVVEEEGEERIEAQAGDAKMSEYENGAEFDLGRRCDVFKIVQCNC